MGIQAAVARYAEISQNENRDPHAQCEVKGLVKRFVYLARAAMLFSIFVGSRAIVAYKRDYVLISFAAGCVSYEIYQIAKRAVRCLNNAQILREISSAPDSEAAASEYLFGGLPIHSSFKSSFNWIAAPPQRLIPDRGGIP